MNIVLYGPPGAGKGTQASQIVRALGYLHLSTGNLIRQEIETNSDLGKELSQIIAEGGLVSAQIINNLVRTFLDNNKSANGIIFDGYPRTCEQAVFLDQLLAESQRRVDVVISLCVDDDQLTLRILGRITCGDCGENYHEAYQPPTDGVCSVCGGNHFVKRTDDTAETIKSRLKIYYEQTFPVLSYYKEAQRVIEVDGMRTQEEVFCEIKEILAKEIA